jgi:hypothetical protein
VREKEERDQRKRGGKIGKERGRRRGNLGGNPQERERERDRPGLLLYENKTYFSN